MKLRWWHAFAAAAVLCVAVAVWWDIFGGQTWMAVHTGTDYCQVPPRLTPACRYYNYNSGFGSVYPFVFLTMGGIFTGLAVTLRHINCHEPGCPWIGRYPAAGGAFKYCGKHHPGWDGKAPSAQHQADMHRLYMRLLGHPDYQDGQAKPV